ncbi:MAG: hypothetical protein REI78_15995 [Pedobacter sp.]|nr:hypothetical protein [Pedobacter sp.]MDQ8054532.1 hypothetical protein [Pedobacter sp.]
MKKRLILLIALFAFGISVTCAHALWIETAAVGKKGKAQEVKVFFGEYEGKEIDSAQKWFSNLKDFSLVLTSPSGKTRVLKTVADLFCHKTSFIPTEDGVYKLSIVHEVATIYENAKIEYYAFADVAVGNGLLSPAFPTNAMLTIKAEQPIRQMGKDVQHQVAFNHSPFAKKKLTLIAPSNKKTEIETGNDGRFVISPQQLGPYFLEAFEEEKTAGQLNGKPYEKIWHVATYVVGL